MIRLYRLHISHIRIVVKDMFTKKVYLISILILLQMYKCYSQSNLPFKFQSGKSKMIVIENTETMETDTIRQGDYVKLWFSTTRKMKFYQPITRIDFNKDKYFARTVLLEVTENYIYFIAPSFFGMPQKQKTIESRRDSIAISEIDAISLTDKSFDHTISSVLVIPFIPMYFTSFPELFCLLPITGILNTTTGDLIDSKYPVNDSKNKFTLRICENDENSEYELLYQSKSHKDQWVYESVEWQNKTKVILSDRLLNEFKGNRIVSFTVGGIFFPNYLKGEPDTKTHVDISNTNKEYGLSLEYFITQKHRIGTEFQFHGLEKAISVNNSPSNVTISGGSGFAFSTFSYIKLGLGNGIYGENYQNKLNSRISSLENEISYSYEESNINSLKLVQVIEPKPYLLFGIGVVNTSLVRVRGKQSDLRQNFYNQKSFALESGFGLFSRFGKRLTSDMSAKYLWSPNYSPPIGGLKSYSGVKLQLNIGFMFGSSYSNMRNQLRNITMNNNQ